MRLAVLHAVLARRIVLDALEFEVGVTLVVEDLFDDLEDAQVLEDLTVA